MKRKNRNRLIVYSLLCVMSLLFMSNGGCGEDFTIQTYRVTFENQSGDTIYYAAFNYFPSNKPEDSHFDLQESDIVHVLKNGEQDEFIEAIQEDDTYLCVLVFKKETWRKYGKEGLVKNKIFDKRYLLTHKELQPMGFKIIYTSDTQSN